MIIVNWYYYVNNRDGKVSGRMQLYSEEKKASQIINGFAAAIAAYDRNASLMCMAVEQMDKYFVCCSVAPLCL